MNLFSKTKHTGERLSADRGSSRFRRFLFEKGALYFFLSFLIPAVIMTCAFANVGIHPFGKNQILVVDLWHQYYPFFRVVREKLLTGGSFLYSWQNGLGTNFLSLIAYYAASPLNWLSVLFSEEYVREALTVILIAKIGFTGAFFSCFLRYTFKRTDFSICVFSSMFALCSYMLGYYWNVMWFDTIALFPLVMLGVVAICREKKWKTFTFSLALSLIANYYIGYFTCIFTIFMFAAAIIIYAESIKDFFVKLWIIARSAVLGIAMGGFILLPAYFGLQLTNSAHNSFPVDESFYESWIDIFANLISYSEPSTKEGLPNFACGMLAIVLFGVFLFSAGIKIREKISAVLMLALIAVSCNFNILNYIWHGFHFTNMIPYRFAFIFSFVLVAAAFRAYDVMTEKGIKIYQLILMFIFPLVVLGLNYLKNKEEFAFKGAVMSSAIIAGSYILIFIAVKCFGFKNKRVGTAILSVCLGAAVITECWSNASLGVKTVGSSGYTSYPTRAQEVESLLAAADKADNSPFYRTEMTKTYTLNDSALYGYYGLSQFSSAANVSVTRFIKRLGLYGSEAGNRYYYRISTPVVNSLLGIKYLICREGDIRATEPALEFSGVSGNVYMYENKYALSLGYMAEPEAFESDNITNAHPFDYQNKVLQVLTGIEEECFIAQPVALAEYDALTVTKKNYGNYSYIKDNGENSQGSVTFTFNGIDGYYLYGYATNGGCDVVSVTNEGTVVDSNIAIDDYPIVFPMGNAQSSETAEVKLSAIKEKGQGSFRILCYAMNEEIFNKAYEKLADEQLEITSFSDREIEGKITALKDGVMVLSMPYEKGWSVYVDGEKVKTSTVLGALMGAEVPAGEHEIRIVYTPEGFVPGVIATLVSVAFCILIAYHDKKKSRKLSEEANEKEKSTPEEGTDAEEEEALTEGENPAEDSEGAVNEETITETENPPEESTDTEAEEKTEETAECGDENEKP